MLRIVACVATLVLLAHVPAAAQIVELEGRYWFTRIEGSAQLKDRSVPGTRIDLEDDLGIGDEDLPEGRLTLATGTNSQLRLAYLKASLEGDKTLERSFQFNGTTFSASSRLETEMDIHYARFGWAYLLSPPPGVFKVGPLIELKGVVIEASLQTRGSGASVRESATLPLVFPTVGLMAAVTPYKMFDLFAEVSGVPFGDLGHVVDAEAGLKFIPIRYLSVSAGYRFFEVRVGDNNDFAKLRFSGPFVGASLRF